MTDENEPKKPEEETLVVGLGGSAGGLEALKTFFKSLPQQTGMAFIVVMHLAPEKESNLAGILKNQTALNVQQVDEETKIEADHVYIIPPNKMLSVEDHHLVLSEPQKKHGLNTIDLLFRTLAEKKGKYAAGIILSGSGSDGTIGLKAIKDHEGFALVQEPDEAASAGMPQSAIRTGVMDKVLPVQDMVEELVQYRKTFSSIRLPEKVEEIEDEDTEQMLGNIFTKIRDRIGHDFGNYRRSSVLRRIGRRMRITQVHTLQKYVNYLDKYPDEIEELYKDLLISVTNFFRDSESFEALEQQVIHKLFEDKTRNDQVRVWIPGCATGEEAYSVAMLLLEYSEQSNNYPEIQVFASDVDEGALQTAREGRYPKAIEEDVSEERLRRFFKENGEEYKVKKELQDIILFASHDLLRNAPFSNQDLIVCRNLLIYLNRDLQSEVFNLLFYSLRPSGWLFLGRSDSHVGTEGLFKTIDRKHHIYQQKSSSRTHTKLPDLPLLYKSHFRAQKETPTQRRQNIEKMHFRILAGLFAPQSALIDEEYNVIHATGGINRYLEYAGGEPSRNILEMAKPKIRQSLRGILFKLRKDESVPDQQKVNVSLDETKLEIMVRKCSENDYKEGLIHVIFKEIEDVKLSSSARKKISDEDISGREAEIIESLEKELEYTKEQLQVSIEQYETSNEELRTSNEELQSMNEELQSTTEELETSKEELQSVNEELKTVNEELGDKVEELSRANSDLQNMMESTEVGILFVDLDLNVHRYTESTTQVFNLISSDEGRPLHHITHSLEYEDLIGDIRQVKETLETSKKLVSTTDGQEFIMRLRPYRSTEGEMEGIVITFSEVTDLRASQRKLEEKERQASALAELGIYVLEQSNLQTVLKRGIDIGCINLELDCAVAYALNRKDNTFEINTQAGCAKKGDPETLDGKWDVSFALNREEPLVVLDYKDENRFSISPYLVDEEIVSSVHIPARGSNKNYGLMGFYSYEQRTFSDHEISFLQSVANIVGMAIERQYARENLEKEIRHSEQLQRELLTSNVAQRWELGGYLHDNLGQSLVSVKILLDGVKNKARQKGAGLSSEVEEIKSLIDDCISGLRDMTHDIIPVDVEEEGVEHALLVLTRQTQKMYNIHCRLETDDALDKIKNREMATHLYHVIQEAVKNAAVHAEAENIVIMVKEKDDDLTILIKDDGVGISESAGQQTGKGLRLIQHRMELLGGSCKAEKLTGENQTGTCVTCTVPLESINGEDE